MACGDLAERIVERIEEQGLAGLATPGKVRTLVAKTGFAVRSEWGSYRHDPLREQAIIAYLQERLEHLQDP